MIENAHIVLADDEVETRKSFGIILQSAGYQVTAVGSGRDALQQIVNCLDTPKEVKLLITDLRMQDIDGMRLIDELAALNITIPVLVMTGYGNKDTLIELMRKGCAEYIDKPFEASELLERIGQIFERQGKA